MLEMARKCACDLDKYLSYTTPRQVVFRDRRLGIVHLVCVVLIFAYIVSAGAGHARADVEWRMIMRLPGGCVGGGGTLRCRRRAGWLADSAQASVQDSRYAASLMLNLGLRGGTRWACPRAVSTAVCLCCVHGVYVVPRTGLAQTCKRTETPQKPP